MRRREPDELPKPTPPPRLHILQAPRAHVAVLFRRGPSKRTEVVRWDVRADTFERGHWFAGRIYERRSDLSPDGRLLVYFANKYGDRRAIEGGYTETWTAVSRPPWLTALALWPKGDAWRGGGLWLGDRTLRLNHWPAEATPHPKHRPRGLVVEPDPAAHGEDDPLYSARLDRDGWALAQDWELEMLGWNEFYVTRAPQVRLKRHPARPFSVEMQRRIDRLKYREAFRVLGPEGEAALPPGRIDWVDWDSTGRLLVLVDGTLRVAAVGERAIGEYLTLADFGPDRPERRVAPGAARVW